MTDGVDCHASVDHRTGANRADTRLDSRRGVEVASHRRSRSPRPGPHGGESDIDEVDPMAAAVPDVYEPDPSVLTALSIIQ